MAFHIFIQYLKSNCDTTLEGLKGFLFSFDFVYPFQFWRKQKSEFLRFQNCHKL